MMPTETPPEVVELFDAVEKNDENAVKLLLEEKGVPVTSINEMDQTIAHVAAHNGNLNLVKYALQKHPSMLATFDFHGESVIFLAIESGHIDIVKYLVDTREVNITQPHNRWFGNTAIHKAAEAGRLKLYLGIIFWTPS
jgi:ankyrin repeat protein